MGTPALRLEAIYAHYRWLVRQHLPKEGPVLKTDVYNEVVGGFRHLDGCGLDAERTIWLELDPGMVHVAHMRHPTWDVRCGDIRFLPLPSCSVVAVVDLSTLDHVPPGDVAGVLASYLRVLLPGGVLILVVWCTDLAEHPPAMAGTDRQFYFHPGDVAAPLAGCDLVSFRAFHRQGSDFLLEVVARKLT